MNSKVSIRCPGCSARIKAPFELLGKRCKCPGCQARFQVRVPPPSDELPALLINDFLAVIDDAPEPQPR